MPEGSPSDEAAGCKEQGNQCLKKRDYAGALRCYKDGLRHLQDSGAGSAAPPGLAAALHANSAQALLRLRRWLEAIEQCNAALQHDPAHEKAAWRGATAAMEVGMRDVASALVESSLLHNPHSAELLELRRRLGPMPDAPPERWHDSDDESLEPKRWALPATAAAPPRSAARPPPGKDKAD
mmetsp:Transcript_28694/g.81080  ORF Transcript_28694/g.81080 Transcript_28694/m.81080 type:complete len:181 (-) Transcript_28694:30-572(-)